MTRIRYKSVLKTALLVTKESILCNKGIANVVIHSDTLVYKIYTPVEVLAQGQGISLSDCKKRVKKDLVLLGANFLSEIRNRGNTEKL